MTFWKYLLFLAVAVALYGALLIYLGKRLINHLPVHRYWRYTFYGVLVSLYLVIGALRRVDRVTRYGPLESLLIVLYTVMIYMLFVLFLTLLRDLGLLMARGVSHLIARWRGHGFSITSPKTRSWLLRRSAPVILVTALLMIFVGHYQAMTSPAFRRVTIHDPRLPKPFEGLTVVLISDMHVGPTLKRPFVERLVERINKEKRDMVVIAGDIGDGPWSEIGPMLTPLARLRPPVYFVPGNHELYWNFPSWRKGIEALGVTVLTERHISITRDDTRLLVAGITDIFRWSGGKTHKTRMPLFALAGAPPADYKILLAHRPTTASSALAAGYDLMLSGHTHGGQFFPVTTITALTQKHGAGLSREGSMLVYTSTGAGFWGPPIRLLNPPEVVIITLKQ